MFEICAEFLFISQAKIIKFICDEWSHSFMVQLDSFDHYEEAAQDREAWELSTVCWERDD